MIEVYYLLLVFASGGASAQGPYYSFDACHEVGMATVKHEMRHRRNGGHMYQSYECVFKKITR